MATNDAANVAIHETVWLNANAFYDAESRYYQGTSLQSSRRANPGHNSCSVQNSAGDAGIDSGSSSLLKRFENIEKEQEVMNQVLTRLVGDMTTVLAKLSSFEKLMNQGNNQAKETVSVPQKEASKKGVQNGSSAAGDDDDLDLFGSDEEDADAAKLREERLQAYANKKAKNNRGANVIEFVDRNDLVMLNDPNLLPIFDTTRRQSWIDLCMTTNVEKYNQFNVDEHSTTSDHSILKLDVMKEGEVELKEKKFRINVNEIKWVDLKIKVRGIIEQYRDIKVDSDNMKDYIENIQSAIMDLYATTQKPNYRHSDCWWNNKLRRNRSLVHALRRCYQKVKDPVLRETLRLKFKKERAAYMRHIIRAKLYAVKSYLGSVVKNNTFRSFYKIIAEKQKANLEVERGNEVDGMLMENKEETIQDILQYHFLWKGEEEIVQLDSLYDDLGEMELKKVPEPEVPFEVIEELYYADEYWFWKIMIKCYMMGKFPKSSKQAKVVLVPKNEPALVAKSSVVLDVKPWDDETDMKAMETAVRAVKCDGLVWGASKLVPLAYGIKKLQIVAIVEDDKVSVDWLQETICDIEDLVQSVDVAAFNKL